MDKVRIGFVGVGNMGQCAHLKHYVTLPGVEVVAIAELRSELGKQVAARYGIPRVYPDGAAMLTNEELDGIVAVQMFTYNGSLLPALYKARLPILTEKPLAGSVQMGEMLVDKLCANGAFHMVAYHKRSDPAVAYARKQIETFRQTGELGALRYVRLVMPPGDWVAGGFNDLITTDEPIPPAAEDPRPDDLDAEGCAAYVRFVNYYIHQVNLLRYLLGEPYRVTYAAPSGAMLAVESASGIAGVIEMDTYRTTVAWEETFLVTFERGYISGSLPAPISENRPGRVELLRDPGAGVTPDRIIPDLPWVGAMRQQAINFVSAIRGESEPPCQAPEALEDLRVAREYLRLWQGV